MTLKFTLLVIFALLISAPAQTSVGERHYEPAGGFSFCPPAGWKQAEVQGQKYKVHFVATPEGLAPNIIASADELGGTLAKFVDGNMLMLSEMSKAGRIKAFRMVARSELTTLAGSKALKAIVEQESGGMLVRQTFYAFEGTGGRKFSLTCTVPAADAEKYEKALDESAKTFRVEGPPAPPKP
jgi:hypothetical protein